MTQPDQLEWRPIGDLEPEEQVERFNSVRELVEQEIRSAPNERLSYKMAIALLEDKHGVAENESRYAIEYALINGFLDLLRQRLLTLPKRRTA